MEEKFYYTKSYIWTQVILGILSIFLFISQITRISITDLSLWDKIDNYLAILVCVYLIFNTVGLLNTRNEPVVMIAGGRIVFRPSLFSTHEVSFNRIISASMKVGLIENRERIKIRYKKPDNKVGSFSIYVRILNNYQRLIGVLKERIEFV